MESLYKRKVFASMRKTKADATKKRPQIGLPSSILDDSDEESCASTTSSSESESEYRGSSASESTPNSEDRSSDDSSTDGGRTTARRKRASLLEDNSSESDSDVGTKPTRKVVPKKRVKRQESDSDADAATQDKKRIAKETAAKRKLRQSKLMALSKKMKSRIPNRRRRSKGTDEEEKDAKDAEDGGDDAEDAAVKASVDEGDGEEKEDTDVVGTDRLIGSSEEEEGADSGSLKDFIVEDEKKKEDNKEDDDDDNELDPQDKAILSLPREFIKGSHLNHFQVVVKALLINVLDETFLKSLYDGERRKRYAQEMKTSLFHFDERTILPRLENLKQRSRWTDRYKERVECYPKVRLAQIGLYRNTCDACLLQRQTSVSVRLSGQLYDSKSLQEDSFMPNDTQAFSVGSVCARRTEVYHILKHFKYHLFQHCRTVLEEEKSGEEEPVKDTVNRVFDKLQQGGWISEQYEKFQDHLNNADYFQEEKLD